MGNEDFLIICESGDSEEIKENITLMQNTLREMNIHISVGSMTTKHYEENFFYLAHCANINMMQQKRIYREQYLGKYQMKSQATTFLNFIEIKPDRNSYQVLYSEYPNFMKLEGTVDDMLYQMMHSIHVDDRKKFLEFWKAQQEIKKNNLIATESFMILRDNTTYVRIEISILAYTNVSGEKILICYSK